MCYHEGCRKHPVLEVWDRVGNCRVIKMYCLIHVPSNKLVLVKAG